MVFKFKKRKLFLFFVFFIVIFYIFFNFFINKKYSKEIFEYNNVPEKKIWLVFWAWAGNWKLSEIYKDRLKIITKAYNQNKVEKILISWDNWNIHYDELTPAWDFLVENWINKNDIFVDYSGFDTYQSLYRAKEIFWAVELNIFSQEYHLPRALYICDKLKLKCDWVKSEINKYNIRETFANIKAFFDTTFKIKPKVLWEKININLDSNFIENEF